MKKIAFCCAPGLETFLSDIIKRLWEHPDFETRSCFSDNPTEIASTIKWADIVWLEWANEIAVHFTKHPTLLDNKHVILRLHSYEALAGYINHIDWNRIDDIIFVCKHIQDLSIAQIAAGKTLEKSPRTWIIPNGIDTNRFEFKERTRGPNIAYLGSINHKKGPMLLLHAFHALFTMSHKYHLHMAGQYQDPRYKFYFKKMIKKLGMENNVHEYGEISKPENWLEDVNYVINSSVLEGHPVGIAEAMAMGIKPLIHSFVGSDNLYPDEWIWHTIPDLKKMVKAKDYNSTEYHDYVIKNGWTLDNQMESIIKILNKNEVSIEPLGTGGEIESAGNDTSDQIGSLGFSSFANEPPEDIHPKSVDDISPPVSTTPDQMAIDWLFKHTSHPESSMKAISVSTASPIPYPEVTGYLIPTLKQFGLEQLSEHYLSYLSSIQNKDGSFNAPGKEVPFAFDTAQVIRGFLTEPENFKPQIRKACDWIITNSSNGRLPVSEDTSWNMGKRGMVPEAVHIYALPPIRKAGELLGIPEYIKFVEKSVNYYLDSPNQFEWHNDNMLLHFYCYIIDGLISLYRISEAKQMLDQLKKEMWPSGGIPAYYNVNWICSPGLAQAAICFYRIGDTETANKVLDFMTMFQNPSGGFFGSYGPDADYFSIAEISWANKFFLDAWHMIKIKNGEKKIQETDAMKADGWEQALDPDIEAIKARIKSLESEKSIPWLTAITNEIPMGQHGHIFQERQHTVLELGSGTAEIAAYLAKNCYCKVDILDNSQKLIDQGKQLFESLDLITNTYCLDLTQKVPIKDKSYGVVFSSGLLEHFEDNDLQHIINESARIASRKVVHLVPNSKCKPYVNGKHMQIQAGTWKWGKERDFETLRPYFEKAGLVDIKEYSVAHEHALRFLPDDTNTQVPDEGYLLVTVGYKGMSREKEIEVSSKKEAIRTLVVVPNDPLQAYEDGGYPDLTDYFNPQHTFDKVYCLSPWETEKSTKYGMTVIPVNASIFQELINDIKPDIIRIYDIRAATKLCISEKQLAPVVISVHDTNMARVEKNWEFYADRWIAKSQAVKDFLIEMDIPKEKIHIVPNGVDTNHFKKMTNDSVLNFQVKYSDKKIVLCVGRWSEQKNQETLLKALDLLPGYIFLFVGIGSETNHPRAYTFQSVPNQDLPLWYSACDCMCVPSRWEGFGIVFAEAMACEASVVTTDIGPMNEYITEWYNGYLLKDPNNPKEIANKIKAACESSNELKQNIGEFARQTVIDRFSKEKVAELELKAMTFEPKG